MVREDRDVVGFFTSLWVVNIVNMAEDWELVLKIAEIVLNIRGLELNEGDRDWEKSWRNGCGRVTEGDVPAEIKTQAKC